MKILHRFRIGLIRAATVGLIALAITTGRAEAGFTVFEAAGPTPASITATRDAFRGEVGGGPVAGADGSFGGLRREINWDGVPDSLADPNKLPGDFFNTTSPRGAVFTTPGSGFLVSANAGQSTPPLFGFPDDFQTFSAPRLFTAVDSNITDVHFFLPGTTTAGTTSAFGVIFTDVEVAGLTKVEFFDRNNTLIFSRDAPLTGNHGLAFLGAVANAGEQIGRVRITSGLNTIVSDGVLGNPNDDVVVMDDLLFAEVRSVPEPSSLSLIGAGILGVLARRRRTAPTL